MLHPHASAIEMAESAKGRCGYFIDWVRDSKQGPLANVVKRWGNPCPLARGICKANGDGLTQMRV